MESKEKKDKPVKYKAEKVFHVTQKARDALKALKEKLEDDGW